MDKNQQQTESVRIFGKNFKIASDEEVDVRQIAAYVDKRMSEVAERSGMRQRTQLAVLAAMEIAAELFSTAQERNMLTAKAHENLDRLTKLVEERADISSGLGKRERVPQEQLLRSQTIRQRDPSRVG